MYINYALSADIYYLIKWEIERGKTKTLLYIYAFIIFEEMKCIG